MALTDKLSAIGNAIREKNGTTELIPLVDMPQAILDLSGDGGANVFWNAYQDNGNRVDYLTAFAGVGWNEDVFKPRYDIKPTNAYMLFSASKINGDLVEILAKQGVVLDTSKATNTQYLFSNSLFTRIGVVDVTSSTNSTQTDAMCRSCTNLTRFEKLVVNEKTKFATNTFNGCSALEYVGFAGVGETDTPMPVISNSLYLQHSPLLNAECVQGIIAHLATVATAQTLTLHPSVVVSDAQKSEISSKGWTLVQ